LLLAGTAEAAKKTGKREDLVNIHLGPDHSTWLVGAISWMATPEEIAAYLGLRDDAAAASAIDAFWQRRDPSLEAPGNPLRELFEERAAEADKLYREAALPGSATDRGIIHILFGEPEETSYELSSRPGEDAIESWRYPPDAAAGLNGEKPDRIYSFARQGDLTVFYRKPLTPDRRRGGDLSR
jgi:GWxTD domain-containing protein